MKQKILRNKKIKESYKTGLSFRKIGKKYNISRTRVWQICGGGQLKINICKKHNRKFISKCPLCEIDENYEDILNKNGNLKEQIELLKIPNRSADHIQKKKILIVKLYDKYGFSFRRIGHLMKMHHSSIGYLYKNYNK